MRRLEDFRKFISFFFLIFDLICDMLVQPNQVNDYSNQINDYKILAKSEMLRHRHTNRRTVKQKRSDG